MIARCIADADALIGGQVIPPHGSGFLGGTVTDSLIACLRAFNEGTLGLTDALTRFHFKHSEAGGLLVRLR